MRSTLVKTLIDLAEKEERIFVITPDLGFSVWEEFEKRFPQRFLNVGVAEANAIGIATGLALCGRIVYVYSIIPFVTMRPFEHIRIELAYMKANVKIVGVGAGVTYGAQGTTHHAIEDIAIMRTLPNMIVFSPCDPWEVEHGVRASLNYEGPIYFRLGKRGEPVITPAGNSFSFGRANVIRRGREVYILFTGNIADEVVKLHSLLESKGISAEVVSMHTLKPFDYEYLDKILKTGKPVFTIEEHNIIGGLGSIVAEYIAEAGYKVRFKRFGIPDQYAHWVGSQKYIRKKFGLSAEKMFEKICEYLE
ncbi:MAG: 1-deoxy-D-xylulose-5-phosphate synthase [Candidatus Cloacimonas sp. 4484_209]|nr:MAG: 1-deoxy-D-xylulose-5-phosphate synthase [Candidatus Cloacimonas sp. 4484_209]HDN86008.1 1-deoxy-D-xylulose-5-phosphate synthase [Candidatus Omnitrophota bacterium]